MQIDNFETIIMKFVSKILIFLSLCISFQFVGAQNVEMPELDEGAYASVMTCGPGEEFYESFGHSAIRICDTANHIDIVFNYGMFYFDEPHFYIKFARGRLNYFVSAQPFDYFVSEYQYFGRSVNEQRLHLSHKELQHLYESLITNSLPENKYYKYDFFRDNCATRVRDMIEASLDDADKPSPNHEKMRNTYRDLIYKYSGKESPWWCFGVDILLGARCDRHLTSAQYMYIPMEMMAQFDTLTNSTGNLISDSNKQLLPQVQESSPTRLTPSLCSMLLFLLVLVLTFIASHKGWRLQWLDAILFSLSALVSVLLLYLWFGSDHWCTKWNFNLLWANPLFFWIVCRLRKSNRNVTIALISCIAAMLLIWLVGWPQNFNSATMLIALTLLLRLFARLSTKNEAAPRQ